MAVLLQKGINADSAGVMITADPYNPESKNAIYISAKRGLGIFPSDRVEDDIGPGHLQ